MNPDEWAGKLYRRFTGAQRAAFVCCVALGYVTHLYAFTNIIPNSDGLSRVNDAQQMTVSGRCFLHYASALNRFTQMPAVIGFLSLIFLGMAAAAAVRLLEIRARVFGGIMGAVMAVFPCIGYTFLYMFTASAYCLAIFLSVLAVWLMSRREGRRGKTAAAFAGGVLCLALSMGIYQVYAAVSISLMLLVLISGCLCPEKSFRQVLLQGIRFACGLCGGAALYYLVLQIFLRVKHLKLLTYLGMDQADAGYPLGQLPALLWKTFRQVWSFSFRVEEGNGFTSPWMIGLDAAAVIMGGYLLVWYIRGKKLWKEHWRIAGVLAMLVLFPLAMNFGQILSPFSVPTPIMKYGFLTAWLLVLFFADRNIENARQKSSRAVPAVIVWAGVALLFCMNTNNLLYTESAQAHRATQSYLTRLVTRIEETEGYEPGMELLIIGTPSETELSADVDSYRQVSHYSVPEDSVLDLNKHIYYYLNDWLNFPAEEPGEDEMQAMSDSEEFQELPLYPEQGSIQVIDGKLVVRLSEKYTPKQDYEIQYEQRK